MCRKLVMMAALLLLVGAQALLVNCDLRCSLMRTSTDGPEVHATMQMAHCQGMSMEQHDQTTVAANDCCSPHGCAIHLQALVMSGDGLGGLLPSPTNAVAELFEDSPSNRSAASLFSPNRPSDSSPLSLRPGVSLRI